LRRWLTIHTSIPAPACCETTSAFVTRLAHYYAEINAVHPFREGNGRTQRAFLGQIAAGAGHPVDWTGLDPDSNIQASRESHRGNNEPLRKLLDGLIAD
jgi:cell filamentation protein